MRLNLLKAIFLLAWLGLVGCVPLNGPNTYTGLAQNQYIDVWKKQLEKYRSDFIEKDANVREEVKKGFGTDIINSPNPWERLIVRNLELAGMIRDAFVIAGRGEAIKAFIVHMESHKTPGLTDVWFQQQGDELNLEARRVQQETQKFIDTFDEKVKSGPEWIAELEKLTRTQGMFEGRKAELESLHKQSVAYYNDIRLADAQDQNLAIRRAQAAQTFFALSAYMNQQNYQQQLLNTLNRPRTCQKQGNFVTCQ